MSKLTVIDRLFAKSTESHKAPKRDRFERVIALKVDTFHCVLKVPLWPAIPVFKKEPGTYYAAKAYTTYNGVEHHPKQEIEFFNSQEERRGYIEQRVKEFNKYQAKRK